MSSLMVSIPNSIRQRAEVLAKDDGISFDQFVASALAEKVAEVDDLHLARLPCHHLQQWAVEAQK